MRKFKTRLRGTNFCTSSARFALSFCTATKRSKCIQIVQNTPKHELECNGVDRVRSLRKIPTRLRGTKFSTSSACFGPSFKSQPNGPKCTKIVRTHHNMSLGSNGVDCVRLLRKLPTQLRGMNFCTSSARFTPSFVTQPNGPQYPKIIRNAPKHEFCVQLDGSGVFVSKNFDATSCHELLYQFGPFCTKFRKSTKRSQMHQNCTKRTKT